MELRSENISVSFKHNGRLARTITLFKGLNISVESGRLTVISGRSGSGKTTLINVLSGLLVPDGGKVLYGDTDIFALSDDRLSEFRNRHIGYIPQGQSAVSSLNVLQNILLPAKLFGSSPDDGKGRLTAERVGLGEFINARPNELSGGELRRLAVARALVNSPDVIFADEPTNDLDDENRILVLDLLAEEAAGGKAVVIVTHDSEAVGRADIRYRMENGVISLN